MIRISLVIPAYNEAKLLPRLLDTVDAARAEYIHGAQAVEVIVSDNDSTDDTAALAADRGCKVVHVQKRLIAAARNGGAGVAAGDVLCFVDADMRIHRDTFNAIEEALGRPHVIAGATGVRLERWSLGITMTYLMLMPLVILTEMDTGVVFCKRSDFEMISGYDERLEFAEDVAFLWALKRLGWRRRQRLTRITRVMASMRKFDRHGDWHYFTGVLSMLWSRSARRELARRYWYTDDR